jgi:molybdopterin-guanine dinucleotide biosynthesis protein A
MLNNNITLIILAGGKSTRMGTDKALLKINGKTFVQHIYDNLKDSFIDVIISSNNPKVKVTGAKIISDEIKNIGPMGGIYTCLKQSKTEFNFIVSVDTPFVSSKLTSEIASRSDNYDITIVRCNNKTNPIIGVYRKNILPILEQEINSKMYKMMKFLEKTNYKTIMLDDKFIVDLQNINSVDDYRKIVSTQ